MSIESDLKSLIRIIVDNDMDTFTSLFKDNSIDFDAPLTGRISNNIIAVPHMRAVSHWFSDNNAEYEFLNQVTVQNRIFTESMIYREYFGRKVDIPVAVMCEMEDSKVKMMRIYHSSEYVVGHRVLRPAIMNPSEDHDIPEVNRRYFDAIKNTDYEEIRAIFADKAYVRGSTKCDFYFEDDNLMTAFERFFAKGSIPLEHCTITQDDKNLIVEFALASWGNKHFIPQCGTAIYTVNDEGLLCSLRIYDDIIM